MITTGSKSVALLLAAGLFLLTGCASPTAQPKALDELYSAYEKECVTRYQDLTSEDVERARTSSVARNDAINDLVLLIDHRYAQIERGLYGRNSWADFTGSVIATGLGTAGTLSGATGIKTTLSALVTAIDSTKVSFSKDILQGQTMIAIVAQMRMQRAQKLLQIRQSEKLSISAYPLSLALDDLMAYYQAGTFVGALQSITEDAAAGKKTADDKTSTATENGITPTKISPSNPPGVIPPAAPSTPAPSAALFTIPPIAQPSYPTGVIPSASP